MAISGQEKRPNSIYLKKSGTKFAGSPLMIGLSRNFIRIQAGGLSIFTW